MAPSTPRFEDALDVHPLDDGTNWTVLEAFHYDTDILLTPMAIPAVYQSVHQINYWQAPVQWRIEVPQGFVTDFASIPRPLWGLVGGPADGKYRKAAVVHDFLYRTPGLCTRSQADSVLLEAMRVSGVSRWQRSVIYSGVRAGGWHSYKGGL